MDSKKIIKLPFNNDISRIIYKMLYDLVCNEMKNSVFINYRDKCYVTKIGYIAYNFGDITYYTNQLYKRYDLANKIKLIHILYPTHIVPPRYIIFKIFGI